MANIYETVVSALVAHWAAHDKQYPRRLVLSAPQYEELLRLRRTGMEGLNADPSKLDPARFMGVPVECGEGAAGLLVAADGASLPLAA